MSVLRITCADGADCLASIQTPSTIVLFLVAFAIFALVARMQLGPVFYWYRRDE